MLSIHMTMGEAFRQVAEPRLKQKAITIGEESFTYGQLLERVHNLAAALYELGINKGDRVACMLLPGVEYATLFFAAAEVGAVFVPLNPGLRDLSLRKVLQDAEPAVLVVEQPLHDMANSTGIRLRHIIPVHTTGEPGPSLDEMAERSHPGGAEARTQVTPEDLLTILYTSGTTGQPKGTMHTHRGLIAPVVASLKVRELWLHRPSIKTIGQTARALGRYKIRLLRAAGRPQVFLSTVPWHSITGIELMLQGLLMGDQMVVMKRFHPRLALELVQREKATILVAIPTAYQVMLGLEDFDRFNTSTLLICGTGAMPCPPNLARQIQERFHCALHIGFGSTETAGGIAIPSIADSNELQATTVGRPLPGVEVKIVDENRMELPAGQVGELMCRGDSIMRGYYGQPEATSEVIDRQGWYATGDLARLDAEGYLHIVGRKKDMIIRGGQNIYPVEVETYLCTHPDIQEAVLVGIPSTFSGEEAWAFVILKPGSSMTPQQVLDYCRVALEPYKIPSQVRIVDDFPRTGSGKPQKYRLQSDILAELGRNA